MQIDDFIKKLPQQKEEFACLIGEKTYYSLSPLMHNTAASFYGLSFQYLALDVSKNEITKVKEVLSHPLCKGINITIPHKNAILTVVDEQEALVHKLKAANTIYKKNGKTVATNTDVSGFMMPLLEIPDFKKVNRAFIFGSGGASKAVEEALQNAGSISVSVVSRKPVEHQLSYKNWTESIYEKDVIILVNASPLGMTNQQNQSPVSEAQLHEVKPLFVYDLIYNPAQTLMMRLAQNTSVPFVLNGLDMLIGQGSEAFKLWTGKSFPIEEIRKICMQELEKRND